MSMSRRTLPVFLGFATLAAIAMGAAGASGESIRYQMPPQAIADIADAPPTPAVVLDPTRTWLLLMEHPAMPSIAELSQAELRLAGIRMNPATNARSRRDTAVALKLIRIGDGSDRAITGLPEPLRADDVEFSPDGSAFAFSQTTDSSMELWVVDLTSLGAKRVLSGLNGVFPGEAYRWRSDGRSLVAKIVPRNRGAAPVEPRVPEGPVVQETRGEAAAAWTYQDLLQSPYDEALFEYYGTTQIVEVDLDGRMTPLGSPSLVPRAEPSPDGDFLLVEHLERPFSYLVPHYRFARRIEISGSLGKARPRSRPASPGGERASGTKRRSHGTARDHVASGSGRRPHLGRGAGWRRPQSAGERARQALFLRRAVHRRAGGARVARAFDSTTFRSRQTASLSCGNGGGPTATSASGRSHREKGPGCSSIIPTRIVTTYPGLRFSTIPRGALASF